MAWYHRWETITGGGHTYHVEMFCRQAHFSTPEDECIQYIRDNKLPACVVLGTRLTRLELMKEMNRDALDGINPGV